MTDSQPTTLTIEAPVAPTASHPPPDSRATADPAWIVAPRAGSTRRWTGNFALVMYFVIVYLATVWTRFGQRFEVAGMRAAMAHQHAGLNGTGLLDTINIWTLVAAIGALGVYAHRRYSARAASLVMALIVGATVTTEVLKRMVLPRPDLLGVAPWLARHSFPSGHTTIALTVSLAAVIVAPPRRRLVVAAVGMVYSTAIAVTTLTTHGHRLGDLVGACIVVSVAADVTLRRLNWIAGFHSAQQSMRTMSRRVGHLAAIAGIGGALEVLSALSNSGTFTGHPIDQTRTLVAEALLATASVLAVFHRSLGLLACSGRLGARPSRRAEPTRDCPPLISGVGYSVRGGRRTVRGGCEQRGCLRERPHRQRA